MTTILEELIPSDFYVQDYNTKEGIYILEVTLIPTLADSSQTMKGSRMYRLKEDRNGVLSGVIGAMCKTLREHEDTIDNPLHIARTNTTLGIVEFKTEAPVRITEDMVRWERVPQRDAAGPQPSYKTGSTDTK